VKLPKAIPLLSVILPEYAPKSRVTTIGVGAAIYADERIDAGLRIIGNGC
jgi:hypothetical protein